MVKSNSTTLKTRRDHRGWSTHTVASRDKPAKPNRPRNGIFVTSGEIGTNAIHPPGERIIDVNKQQNRINTRGRTLRSAPTRRICWMVGQSNMGHRKSHIETNQRDAGWNVERGCREPVISAGGGCKPAIIRRLPGRAPSTMVISSKSLQTNPP